MKVFNDEKRSRVYMVMEWVEGQLLRMIDGCSRKFPRGPRGSYRGAHSARRSTTSTASGVMHRDMKPENIMVDAEDRIKLIDFGIAATRARGA